MNAVVLQALHYKKYSTASDVWSFGCLMYEIWSLGHKPFEDYTNSQVSDGDWSYLAHNLCCFLHYCTHITVYIDFMCKIINVLLPQAIKMVDGGYRLTPPPGCPRALYQLMINCWSVNAWTSTRILLSAHVSAGTLPLQTDPLPAHSLRPSVVLTPSSSNGKCLINQLELHLHCSWELPWTPPHCCTQICRIPTSLPTSLTMTMRNPLSSAHFIIHTLYMT